MVIEESDALGIVKREISIAIYPDPMTAEDPGLNVKITF
jgi:hypothetical protein